MSILNELFKIESGSSPSSANSKNKESITVNKTVSPVGKGGKSIAISTVKCKTCHEVIMLSPKIPSFTCNCGITYSLPEEQ